MKKKKMPPLKEDEVRVIKIGEEALFEFIYEKFIDDQECYLDVEPVSVTDSFYIDWENRQFIFCAYKSENEKGDFLKLPESIDLETLIRKIPDTTNSMYSGNRYKTFTKNELEISASDAYIASFTGIVGTSLLGDFRNSSSPRDNNEE